MEPTPPASDLENTLETRLFSRSTRSMQLSDAGERYFPFAKNMLDAQRQGQATRAGGDVGRPNAAVGQSAPSGFGRNLLLPWLDAFLHNHPEVSLHLRTSDRTVDLMRQPIRLLRQHWRMKGSVQHSGIA